MMIMLGILLTAILPFTTALQWTDSLTNNTVMTVCSNSDIHLPWNFTLSPDERIEHIKWIYWAEDGSDILIAIFADGQFVPTPAFSGHVQWTSRGGIVVSRAAVAESGNYAVSVSTGDTSHPLVSFSKTVYVQVADPPTLLSGELHVQQKSEAVYDNTTGQWRVQLNCGILRSQGQPAVHVVWTTPEGHTMKSSSEDNGTFQLLLPNPPSGGNYTCSLPPLSPARSCLPPLSPLLEGATVTVDQIKASFTVLEARMLQQDREILLIKSELESERNKSDMLLHAVSSIQARLDDGACNKTDMPRNCVEARLNNNKSGVVTIYLANNSPLQVYCDQDTDGGGWLVFQRRQDGSVDFYRNWTSYQNGFGDVSGEFWLGLDALYMLTSNQNCELRVDLTMWNGTKGNATYSNFSISNSSDNYRLSFNSFTGGNAGDSLSSQRGMQFSTRDRDHDTHEGFGLNCAVKYHGAWWYNKCHESNLNADYKTNSNAPAEDGLNWKTFAGYYYSMKFTEMKLRPT